MVYVVNDGESAHQTGLIIHHSPSLSYIASKSEDGVNCKPIGKQISCYVGNVLRKDQSARVEVRFNANHLEDDESQLDFIIEVNTTSRNVGSLEPVLLHASVSKFADLSIHG